MNAITIIPPPPPPSSIYDSFEELFSFLQAFHLSNGAALVKANSSSSKEVNGIRIHTQISLVCDRGQRRASTSTGLRNPATVKLNCSYRLTASTSARQNWQWTYRVLHDRHNHPPSLDPSAHTSHRKRSPQQLSIVRQMSQMKGLQPRELASIIRTVEPHSSHFRMRDLYNDRQRIRVEDLNGLTATQALIGILRQNNIRHHVKYDDHKVEAVFWTYPWCEQMWRRYPEVLGLDNTYKTNRFKMYLFQVTGVTDQKSLANFAFGLVRTEKEEGYRWLCEQLDKTREEICVPTPAVVITDKEAALKKALAYTFPHAQQQLCVYHINANVRGKITSRWKSPAGGERPSAPADENSAPAASASPGASSAISNTPSITTSSQKTEATSQPDDNVGARSQMQEEAEAGTSEWSQQPDDDDYSREGMFSAWKRVIYAPDEAAFESAWSDMKRAYSPSQTHILRYISDEYMPWRQQWAKCFINRYRNYGQRVNSPCETAHKDVKSFLVNGQGDLLHLHTALIQMIEKKERAYQQRAAEMQMRQRRKYLSQSYLGDITIYVSYTAIELIARQYRYAAAALPDERQRREVVPLRPCRELFRHQYGLPCSHDILPRLETGQPLNKYDVFPRWWLHKPLDITEPLLRIRNPDPVLNTRGRPRLEVSNSRLSVPTKPTS